MNNNVLIISPHADDGELGCGGTIAKLVEQGMIIHYIAFSISEETIPEGLSNEIMLAECKMATEILGIKPENTRIKRFPIRKFDQNRQEILEILIELRNEIMPAMIFMPSSQSIHQDHKTIFNEGIRAFKHTTCFGYDLPWDTANFKTTSFYSLTENQVNRKIEALKMYQALKERVYMKDEFIRGLARVRGTQISVKYAEAFEAIRTVF